MANKALVLCTLRDRDTHWRVFRMYMAEFYPELTIAIIQQADNLTWNKGLLYNTGYALLAQDYDYVILHDIDFLPVVGKVDYGPCDIPCMIAGEASQFNYQLMYPTFFGGVIVCSKQHYEQINGFSNKFRGYGGEDDSMYHAFREKGISTGVKMGRFECFTHPRPDIRPGTEFYNSADYQHNLKLCTSPRDFTDGLSNYKDYVSEIVDATKHNNYIHIKVKTK